MLRKNKSTKAKKGDFQPIETMVGGDSDDEASPDMIDETGVEDAGMAGESIDEGGNQGNGGEIDASISDALEQMLNEKNGEGNQNSNQEGNESSDGQDEGHDNCGCDNGGECGTHEGDCCGSDEEQDGDNNDDNSDKEEDSSDEGQDSDSDADDSDEDENNSDSSDEEQSESDLDDSDGEQDDEDDTESDDNNSDDDSDDDNSDNSDSSDNESESDSSDDSNNDADSESDSNDDDSGSGNDESDNESSSGESKVCKGVISIKEDIESQIGIIEEELDDIHQDVDDNTANLNILKSDFNKTESHLEASIDVVESKIDELKISTNEEFKEIEKLIKNAGVGGTRKIEIITDKNKPPVVYEGGHTHEKFDLVLKLLLKHKPVLIWGVSGAGKSHMAKQIAKANNWKYYFTNQVMEEYKLTGFVNAHGEYQSTPFFDAFTKGGLFLIDEIDASIPEVLICLNMALANGEFAFPHGMFDMHKDFRVMAAANTIGGANSDYTGRSKLDRASLDRFAMVEMDYDNVLEEKLLSKEVFDLILEARNYIGGTRKINAIFSTRCGLYYDDMKSAGLETVELVKSILLRGLDVSDFKSFGKDMESKTEVYNVRKAIYDILEEELPEEVERKAKEEAEKRRKKKEELKKKREADREKDIISRLPRDSINDLRRQIDTDNLSRLSDNDVRLINLWERFSQE